MPPDLSDPSDQPDPQAALEVEAQLEAQELRARREAWELQERQEQPGLPDLPGPSAPLVRPVPSGQPGKREQRANEVQQEAKARLAQRALLAQPVPGDRRANLVQLAQLERPVLLALLGLPDPQARWEPQVNRGQ